MRKNRNYCCITVTHLICTQYYRIWLPCSCAAYVYLVEWDAKNMVHKRVLEQPAEERPFSVFLLDKPARVSELGEINLQRA